MGVLCKNELTKYILCRQNPLTDYKYSSFGIGLFTTA